MAVPNPIIVTGTQPILTKDTYNANNSNIATRLNHATLGAVFKNEDATLTGVITFSVAPIINAALSIGGTLTTASTLVVTAGGLVVTAGGAAIGGSMSVSVDLAVAGITNLHATGITGTLSVSGAVTFSSTFNGVGAVFSSGVSASSFGGIGSSLTALTAANITAGGTLPALNGSALTNLNASALQTGSVPTGLLPTSYSALAITALNVNTMNASGAIGVQGLTVQSTPTIARVGGAPGTIPAFVAGQTDECISSSPGSGAARYLRIQDGNGNTYMLEGKLL